METKSDHKAAIENDRPYRNPHCLSSKTVLTQPRRYGVYVWYWQILLQKSVAAAVER